MIKSYGGEKSYGIKIAAITLFRGLIRAKSFYRARIKNFYSRSVHVIRNIGDGRNQGFLSGSVPPKTRERIELYFIVRVRRERWICRRRL